MNFGRVELEHLDEVFSAFQLVVSRLNAKGNFQWTKDYPSKALFKSAIANRALFVLREFSDVRAIAILDNKQDVAYRDLDWKREHPAVIHQFAVIPKFWARGYGQALLKYLETEAKKAGYDSLRLDTFADNKASNNFYKKLGYAQVGEIELGYVPGKFNCYEKVL